MIKGIKKIQQIILQMLFPLRCPVCDRIAPFGEKVCPECREQLKPVVSPWCMKCGKKLRKEGELCEDCRRKTHLFERGRILYEYESAAPSIYRMKYGKRREYADFFGEEMVRYLGDFIQKVRPDALIPIPLHRKRLKKRGYNQAALLARAISSRSDVPVYENLLLRVKNTAPLKSQNPEERQNNLKKAFIIAQNDVKLKTIIIIDDIYTTGSTVDEAAATCKAAGIQNVYFIALSGGASI